MGGRLPIVLDWTEMGRADEDHTRTACLHYVTEHRGHVQVLWHQEDVTEILDGCCLHSDRDSGLANLFEYEFENVFAVFETQTIA